MIANTYGNIKNPKIVLINPYLKNDEQSKKIIKKIIKKYHLTVLTLDGLYPFSTFKSYQKEELEMSIFFKSHNYNKIDILIGLSIGGNIAYDFYCKNTDIINRLIIDSAPLLKYNYLKREYYYYKNCRKKMLINKMSLRTIIHNSFNIKIFNLSKKNQEKMTFIYGSKDRYKKSLKRLKKYKYINYQIIKNADSCQYFTEKTNSYLKKIINKTNE